MKASVVTLGCKVNQFESSAITENLIAAGYEIVKDPVDVNLVILNTCTVTHKADKEALSLLRKIAKNNPQAKIIGTGCLAQSNPELLQKSGLVDLVLGQAEKADITQYLNIKSNTPLISDLNGKAKNFGAPKSNKTRVFYKIQDGCSARCSYCAVPLSRGSSRSLDLDDVLTGLRKYLSSGITEIVLCGIHLGHWGLDLTPKSSISELMHIIEAELSFSSANARLRLSSIEPMELNGDLIEAYEMYPWLAKHFHLPLQSGCDKILKLMHRPYNTEQFSNKVKLLKEKWPLSGLGLDVMVGFPGETEEDFEITANFIESLPVTYLHIFPYSKRPGTKAAEYPNQIPENEKKARVNYLKNIANKKRIDFESLNKNVIIEALVENTPDQETGCSKVLTENYLQALLPALYKNLEGKLINVKIGKNSNGFLEASVL